MELTIAEIQEAISARVPERECVVDSKRRTTYDEFNRRSRQLANFFTRKGLGCKRDRGQLRAWESGQDHIGLYMYNCTEYLECEFGILKARAVAININFRYVEKELLYLFKNAEIQGTVFHSAFAEQIRVLRAQLPMLRTLVQVPDESASPLIPGAIWFEDAVAEGDCDGAMPICSPDDLHILYTGGTTGLPKGVLWRQADIVVSALGGRRPDGSENTVQDFVLCADKSASRTLPAGPFMHASGRWPSMAQLLLGNTVIIPANTRRLDPDDVWSTAERERVEGINIAGDAFARPLLEQLSKRAYDLRRLKMISSGAAVLSVSVKRELLLLLPNVAINDTIGASETGPQASAMSRAGDLVVKPAFRLTSSTTVLSEDLSHVVPSGDAQIGWLARSGRVPLGYLADEARTQSTFPVVQRTRYAVPGDRARWNESGEIELLGRDAAMINSGGEKIYAEEVEVAIKHHVAVYDAVVCGRPSERWGQEVVALVSVREGMKVSEEAILFECAKHIARYKLPKAIIFKATIERTVSGKPDYNWARAEAVPPDLRLG